MQQNSIVSLYVLAQERVALSVTGCTQLIRCQNYTFALELMQAGSCM